MKRFLSYCLLAVTLFVGVAYTFMSHKESLKSDISAHNDKTTPVQYQYILKATDFFQFVGVGNEPTHVTNAFQQISTRIFSSSSNTLRMVRSSQLIHLKISTGNTVFLLKSSFKQLDGYYLYHLRKLLI